MKTAKFLEHIGATIEGVKPAEILTIGKKEHDELYAKYFCGNKVTIMRTIRWRNARRQVFVYHRRCLCNVLEKKSVQWFLISLGYPRNYSIDDCVGHLIVRLHKKEFPHEIGVFLGYPLKDVFGYVGLNSLPHTKTKGWCMYGDTSNSEKLHEKYRCARERAGKKLFFVN